MCGSSSSSPHSCSRVIFANARLPGFPLVLRTGRGAEEGGNGRRMERGVDSILRLFRFFLHPGSHRIKQLFFPNFLTTNERAVDAVVYPRPCTKAARNLRVAHLPRFFPPLYVRLCSTEIHDTWGNFNSVSLSTAKPTLRFFSARVARIERGYDKVEILGL